MKNAINGRTYVGMTTDLDRRVRQHRSKPPTRMRRDSELWEDRWHEVFQVQVLQVVTGSKAAAQRAEARYILELDTTGKAGYNNVDAALPYSRKLQYLLRNYLI